MSAQQCANNVLFGVFLVHFGQLHGVVDNMHRGHFSDIPIRRHFRILIEHHGVGPLEEVLAIFSRHTAKLQNRQQGEFRRHFFDKLALAARGHAIHNVPGVLAKALFIGTHGTRGKCRAHDLAVFELPRGIHIDNHLAVDVLDLLGVVFLCQRGACFAGKQLRALGDKVDFIAPRHQPVRYALIGIVHVVNGAGFPDLTQHIVGHAFGIGFRIDHRQNIQINETVIQGRDQRIGIRMSNAAEEVIRPWRVDHDVIVARGQVLHGLFNRMSIMCACNVN